MCFVLLVSSCSQNTATVRETATVNPPADYSIPAHNTRDRASLKDRLHIADEDEDRPAYPSIWPRIFSLYRLPKTHNSRIDREMRWFLNHRDYLLRVQRRAEPFLYEIVKQVQQQGIPGEFALLPVIESAFQPYAYSPARAHGIWQFIPSTGRLYGLKQNWWYDGRRDIYASTQAAIRYLQKLKTDFHGDWLLALAAYNCGEGNVQKAVNRNLRRGRPIDFWSLKLPRETSTYVPRLLAVSRLFANAKLYRIALRPIPDRPVVHPVHLKSQIDLHKASELAGISIAKMYELNPGYNQWASDPNGPHRLLLPLDRVEPFHENLENLPASEQPQWRRHQVQRGDTIHSLARRYGTTPENIERANRITGGRMRPGRYMVIPVATDELAHLNLRANPFNPIKYKKTKKRSKRSRARKKYYKIRRGDTLSRVARRYGVSVKQLAKWNGMSTRSRLITGKTLAIWSKGSRRSAGKSRKKKVRFSRYTVRKGDSLSIIARRFKVNVADLRRWNKPRIGKYLQPGQKIKVRKKPAG